MIHFAIFTFGACLLGFGVALYCTSDIGADPLSTFALGIGKYLPLSVDEGIILISYGMILCTCFIQKSNIGFGSFLYPFMSGVATKIGFLVLPVCNDLLWRYGMLFCGILCMGISIALTAKTRVGYSPYDGFAFSLMNKWSCSYSKVRWLIDGSFLCAGVLLGAIFDTGTIIVLLIMGPCASCCMRILEQFIRKFKKGGIL